MPLIKPGPMSRRTFLASSAAGASLTMLHPFSAFAAKGGAPQGPPAPGSVRSIALAAYGRDHEADVSLAAIGLY